jgi:hypothetical protein
MVLNPYSASAQLKFQPERQIFLPRFFMAFLSPTKKMPGEYTEQTMTTSFHAFSDSSYIGHHAI